MAETAVLNLPDRVHEDIRRHVLPARSRHEEAAFVFARDDGGVFTFVDVYLVPPEGFEHRSPYYLELTDETRQFVVKRGHDLGVSVIEVHSHPMQKDAAFSWSDRSGFREFVPIIRWRHKGRPYGAIVMTKDSFDSLAWFGDIDSPVPLSVRLESGVVLAPTGITHSTWGREGDDDE